MGSVGAIHGRCVFLNSKSQVWPCALIKEQRLDDKLLSVTADAGEEII